MSSSRAGARRLGRALARPNVADAERCWVSREGALDPTYDLHGSLRPDVELTRKGAPQRLLAARMTSAVLYSVPAPSVASPKPSSRGCRWRSTTGAIRFSC